MYTANAVQTQISLFREQACDSCSDKRTVTHPPPPNNSRNSTVGPTCSQEHASPFPITLAHDLRLHRGVYPGVGDIDPWKYVAGVRVCLDPLKCHILSFKTVECWSNDTTATYTCGTTAERVLQAVRARRSHREHHETPFTFSRRSSCTRILLRDTLRSCFYSYCFYTGQ